MMMMRLLAGIVLAFWTNSTVMAATAAPAAVASIKPVHSLLAAVMGGAGRPALLIDGHASPHTYALKPSDASVLENSTIIFRIGPEMEAFLNGPLETLAASARIVDLADTPGLVTLGFRPPGVFVDGQRADPASANDHDEHHEEQDHGADHDGHEHGNASFDMHLWLDPVNAGLMAARMATVLGEIDPDNADLYQTNASALKARLEALAADIDAQLEPVRDAHFLVFHDAFHYFENRFRLKGAGSMVLNPQSPPGAETISELGDLAAAGGIVCAFVEPQYPPRLVEAIAGQAGIRTGTLDPLGASLDSGPEQYEALMRKMAQAFRDCLGGT